MKLCQKVHIEKYYEPVHTWNPCTWELRGTAPVDKSFSVDRYAPMDCNVTGYITGYKRITVRSEYNVCEHTEYDELGHEVKREHFAHKSSDKEYIYVVQPTLTKKYFVRKDWIELVNGNVR